MIYVILVFMVVIFIQSYLRGDDINSLERGLHELRDFKMAVLTYQTRLDLISQLRSVDADRTYNLSKDAPTITFYISRQEYSLTIFEAEKRLIELSGKLHLANCNKVVKRKKK